MVRKILLLGNDRLYNKSAEVAPEELDGLAGLIEDLHDTLMAYRKRYGAGRAIAAPQIGVEKRVIYMNVDGKRTVLINPQLTVPDGSTMEVLDDCMSFPHLKVKVRRYQRCCLDYIDEAGSPQSAMYEGDMSELVQHEYDHLNGVLATMKAIDNKSFYVV